MRRTRHDPFAKATTMRYVVTWDMQRTVIECQQIPGGSDLRAALAAVLERLVSEGWRPEGLPDFGFVFLSRGGERRLLALTERDPHMSASESFNPFH
jgi:hypothetical protein